MYSYFMNELIYCECGKTINVGSFVSDVANDARHFGGDDCGEDTFICESCEREHKLTIEVSVEVSVDSSKLETVNPYTDYIDTDGKILKRTFFENLRIGDEVTRLEDGQYVIEEIGYIIDITGGIVRNRFSSVIDENQLSLFEA